MHRRVYIIDDEAEVRDSLARLLSIKPGLVVRSFESGDKLLESIDECAAGVLLLDLDMPGTTGLDVLRILMSVAPGKFAPIIVTGQGSIDKAVSAMKAGAVDFIEKPYQSETLLNILSSAFAQHEQAAENALRTASARAKIDSLSPRERDVLKWLIEGQANKNIAFELSISARTVEIYRANLMAKLQARSLAEAIRIAFAAGLFSGSAVGR
jgi:two-component system response regulator FixJ